MRLIQLLRSYFTFLIVIQFVRVTLAAEWVVGAEEDSDLIDEHDTFGLIVELYPLDTVQMYEGGEVEVNLYIEANWTLMWNLSHTDDVTQLPLWFRCPGVINVISDDSSLLEVINGTLNVTGGNFFNINHTVTLRSHHRGPAYQYLQVHWTSTMPPDECHNRFDEELFNDILDPDGELPVPHLKTTHEQDLDTLQVIHDKEEHLDPLENEPEENLDPLENEPEENLDPLENESEEISDPLENEPEENTEHDNEDEHESPAEDFGDNTPHPGEHEEKNVMAAGIINFAPAEDKKEHEQSKFNLYNEGLTFQVFRRRRRETQDQSEIHHHHHYDETEVTVEVTVPPKTETLSNILLLNDYKVAVLRVPSILDKAFIVVVSIVVAFNTFNMGMQLDIHIVISVFKKPIGPIVGFISQFLFMPLASFGLAHVFFTDVNQQLGLFTLGCSPGGNGSNFWTLLLHGDLNLSITMTFVSTTCAMFMMPFWLYTLGQTILSRGEIEIPIVNLLLSLVSFTIPIGLGLLTRHFKKNWADFGRKLIRPCTFILIIVVNIMAIANSMYIFRAMTWKTVAAGMCVAWGGYMFGGFLAFICRQGKPQIIAISIETAIQNAGITFAVLRLTLSQPAADLSMVAPVSQMIVTAGPLLILYTIIMIRRRIIACRKGKRENKEAGDAADGDPEVEKPLMINNIIIEPKKVEAKSSNAQIILPPPKSPRIYADYRTTPVYENIPTNQRVTVVGESNV